MKKSKLIQTYDLCVFADLFTNVDETAEMARSIVDSQGVCFVPGFQVNL